MRRTDAEKAISEFDGFNWGGHVLRIGWSKAIPIPAKALFGEAVRQTCGNGGLTVLRSGSSIALARAKEESSGLSKPWTSKTR